jgi:hypothetical protein
MKIIMKITQFKRGFWRGMVLLALALPAAANAGITFYDNAASFNTLHTTTLVDDFDTGSTRETALSSLVRNGVTYTPLAGVPNYNVWLSEPGYTNFGAGVGTTKSGLLTGNGDEHFIATFAVGVGAVSFDTYRNGLGPSKVSVYSGSTILGSFTPTGNPDNIGFMGFASSTEKITAFEWESIGGGQINTGIDNLRSAAFVASVPEPETYAMLLAGLGLIGAAVKRRKAKQA